MSIFGNLLHIGPSADSEASDFVSRINVDKNYNGTAGQLQSIIAQQVQDCIEYGHGDNGLLSRGDLAGPCQSKVNAKYAPLLGKLQSEDKVLSLQVVSPQTLKIAAMLLLTLILLVIILK